MNKELVPNNIKIKLINNYKSGGINFEDNILIKMGNLKNIFYSIIDRSNGIHKWLYVGDSWWCRKLKSKYEFGRLYAIPNEKGRLNEMELWDASRHAYIVEPEVVFYNNRDGVIVGYNGIDLYIKFKDSISSELFIGDVCDLKFKFYEDYMKYSRMFKLRNK